jgi:glc operon protein GlcG
MSSINNKESIVFTKKVTLAAALVALSCMPALGAELATKWALNLAVAKQMAQAAEAEAAKNQWTMVTAIVDDGGNLIYLQRMDETQIGSIDVAQRKAQSALKFKRPTKVLEDAVASGRAVVMTLPGALPIEGGVPITVEGRIIGAIGVSGGTSAQDGQVAKAGLDALPRILGK